MASRTLLLLVAFAIALSIAVPVTAADDAARSTFATPLLEAMAYGPADEERISVEFTDWAAIKAQHGASHVTSAATPDERQAFLRAATSSEAVSVPATWDLELWRDTWGWDTSDVDWHAMWEPSTAVLRFGEGWDADVFATRLEDQDYTREDRVGSVVFRPGARTRPPVDAELERLGEHLSGRVPVEPRSEVAIADDGRTVVVDGHGDSGAVVEHMLAVDPVTVSEGPLGRTAARLGTPLAATIRSGDLGCSGTGDEYGSVRRDAITVARAAGTLHPYDAFGIGYERTASGWPVGRYVFDYQQARDAAADLDGRRTLIEAGLRPTGYRSSAGVPLPMKDRIAAKHDQVFDVALSDDRPSLLFDQLDPGSSLITLCGPQPREWRDTDFPASAVPLFVGPATTAVRGGPGTHRWTEVHFGADKVRIAATVRAGDKACSTSLRLDEGKKRVARGSYKAAASKTATRGGTLGVDYATTSMTIDSTCDSWVLRFESIKDPNLPYRLRKRYYAVRGATLQKLDKQLDHIDDEWAAYARWRTSWRYWWRGTGTGCTVTHGSVSLTSTITYPRWKRPKGVDPAVEAEWERFLDNITTHELGHVTIALQGADAIHERLDGGFSASSCGVVERQASTAANKLHKRWAKVNGRYDDKTDHGITQGTALIR